MNERDQRFITYWKQKRQQGAVKFSLVTGVVYGVFVVVFSKVFAWNWHFTQKDIVYGIFSILVGITVLGPFLWWHRERKYKKLMATQKPAKKSRKK